jgi:enediyne biosynthesis protein E4
MRLKPCFVLVLLLAAWPARAALQWQQREGYRAAKLEVPAQGRTGFTLLTPALTGIHFTNQLTYDRSQANQNLLNGAGLAAGDCDGDGLCDLYFCNLEGANGLFRNKGNWTFENVTTATSTACTGQTSRAAVFADVDGDSDLDLFVPAASGPNALLLNDGKGNFKDGTAAAGLTLKAGCHSVALADVDGDGDLDLYIANNGEISMLRSGGAISVRMVNGKPVVTGRVGQRIKIIDGQFVELGEPDAFYLNNGNGTFTRLSWTDGRFLDSAGQALKAAYWDQGLSVMFRDINADGHPDIYVCNDFETPDRIWLNDGKGTFGLMAAHALRTTCYFAMGVDFADIDRDGDDDFFVSDMLSRIQRLRMRQISATNPPPSHVGEDLDRHQARRNVLQLNRGDGTYADIANFAGVDASDWTWTVLFLDVDLDGYEDLLVANGHAYDTQDRDLSEKTPSSDRGTGMQAAKQLRDFPPLETPNYVFRNRGNRTFEETGAQWGFNSTQVSHGISLADLDNDGDQDLAVSCLWKAPLIYRNESTAPRVAVRLRGKAPNTQGIGAKIKVLGGAVPEQTQEIISGGRYLSGDDPMRVFAAGSLTNKLSIGVTWRSGRHSVINDALPNHIYEIDEAKSEASPAKSSPMSPPSFFKDISDSIAHRHAESMFNDFERQPLLHRQLSKGGPGVALCDVDGNGIDDVIIGAARGSAPGMYFNSSGGRPAPAEGSLPPVADDLAGLSWALGGTNGGLLGGVSGYESDSPALVIAPLTKSGRQLIERKDLVAAAGPVATADIDDDGDLDIFVGGSVNPGKYPEPAPSRIYRNDSGMLVMDALSEKLKTVGLVNGAVFSDLTGDGKAELILACEWGAIRVFEFKGEKLNELTASLGLAAHTGWWMSVTTGDFDGDGRLDIVAGNWGLNSSYHQPTQDRPLRLYYSDFDGNGSMDLIEAFTDPQLGKIVPRRDLAYLSTGLPLLRTRFITHAAFSEADFSALLGKQPDAVPCAVASTLATTVFLNRTNRFEAIALADEAQFAPVFGVNVADFDGDGDEDIFLAQNFFGMRLEEPRLDAGRGLWLKNDGKGKFTAVPGQESGVIIYGEQRGSAVGDFDGDARVDLLVAQNGGQTKLYRNERAKPGLRVRLEGPPGNPSGIGATVWLSFGSRNGSAREIHGGSGYWSQDSLTPVLGTPEAPSAVNVRWPGGRKIAQPIPTGTNFVRVRLPL